MDKYLVNLSNWLIDWFSGFNLDEAAEKAVEFDFLSRDEIDRYQEDKFRILASWAATSRFYKGLEHKRINEFPVVKREDYIREYEGMRTAYDESCYESVSSGSTGSPVKHIITKPMLLAKRASHQKVLKWNGLSRESREMKLGGIPCSLKQKIYYCLRNKRYYSSYDINAGTLPAIVKKYNNFRPEVLYGYPTTIEKFILYSKRANLDVRSPKAIICHAENLYDSTVSNFRSIFPDAKIINQYWATEANIAVTCPEGNLHIDENTIICEVLNKDSRGVGDLYITNLFSYKVPIIRYNIGDKVKISEKTCPCGRTTKFFEFVEGRAHEYLELANGEKFPLTAIYVHSFYENVLFYQLVHFKKENRVLFRYIPADETKGINMEAIELFFRKNFGLSIEFTQVSDMEYTAAGKVKRLVVMQ